MGSRIVLLAREGPSTRAIYGALVREFGDVTIVLEPPISRWRLLRARARRLGLLPVVGQIGFMAVVHPVLRVLARRRLRELRERDEWSERPLEGAIRVPSVNSDEARRRLSDLAPEVVVVNGTRIIGRETLGCIRAPILNMHAGITPAYRGVHGGYWALAEGRSDLVGTTVHLIDPGIDTGDVIAQATFAPSGDDNFATYPYLHTIHGLPLLVEAVRAALEGRLEAAPPPALPSRLRYHPTLWGYLFRRMVAGVR